MKVGEKLFNRYIFTVRKLRGFNQFGNTGYSLNDSPSIKGKLYVNKIGELTIGKRLGIVGRPWSTQLTVEKDAVLTIGNDVFINAGCGIAASKEIRIGNNVLIGPRTSILDSDYHLLDADVTSEQLKKPIIIEDNVWIGTRCTILPGVKIGKNSVISAGSIVNKDIPPNVVAGGVPVKVIRELNTPDGWIRR
ncbi:acetyltransferase-like isoleucine patch superfamily enzyme [Neobacillus niacini]|uniref:acyltransferase n=1 Tax=Neobacillus niacini TaxID=86668 RepID=UPI002785EFFA|nr:acyltransferase [Neobacillus niacini]MDQ1000343.1 acetyltransferase-like isoleucine patch superfamily enzyme [Neobacillus niacini]